MGCAPQRHLIVALLFSACAAPAQAAPLLTVLETNRDGRRIRPAVGATPVPLNPQRVLADLLDAGGCPVAANVNVPDNVPLLHAEELDGIELFPAAGERALEALNAFQPDLISGTSFFIEQIGYQRLNRITPTVALGSMTPLEQDGETLTLLGRGAEAPRPVDSLRAAVQAAAERSGAADQQVSLVTVYPGVNVAFWLDGPTSIPLLGALGGQLRPDTNDWVQPHAPGTNGISNLPGDSLGALCFLPHCPHHDRVGVALGKLKRETRKQKGSAITLSAELFQPSTFSFQLSL